MIYNRVLPIFESENFEIYAGLFGPQLTLHRSPYDGNRLVISLIFLKFYILLSKKFSKEAGIYGVYSETKPDRLLFCWGDSCKRMLMPWAMIVAEKRLIDIYGDVVEQVTEEYFERELDCYDTSYFKKEEGYMYYVTLLRMRPSWFKNCKSLTKEMYDVKVFLDNGNEMSFITRSGVCIPQQINFYMDIDKYTKDF